MSDNFVWRKYLDFSLAHLWKCFLLVNAFLLNILENVFLFPSFGHYPRYSLTYLIKSLVYLMASLSFKLQPESYWKPCNKAESKSAAKLKWKTSNSDGKHWYNELLSTVVQLLYQTYSKIQVYFVLIKMV